jgi:hypothetical protein
MKFSQEEIKFQPITIVLETQEEAEVLKDLLKHTNGTRGDSVAFRLWSALQGAGVPDVLHWNNTEDITSVEFE